MKKLLEYLLRLIVDYPGDVSIEEIKLENNNFQYNIKANQVDIGKIIGREGKIISAIRSVVMIKAIKENCRIRIEIV